MVIGRCSADQLCAQPAHSCCQSQTISPLHRRKHLLHGKDPPCKSRPLPPGADQPRLPLPPAVDVPKSALNGAPPTDPEQEQRIGNRAYPACPPIRFDWQWAVQQREAEERSKSSRARQEEAQRLDALWAARELHPKGQYICSVRSKHQEAEYNTWANRYIDFCHNMIRRADHFLPMRGGDAAPIPKDAATDIFAPGAAPLPQAVVQDFLNR